MLIQPTNILNLVVECLRFHDVNVRQSALAVMGDFAKNCPELVKSHVNEIVPLLLGNINPEFSSVCNNASWAFGELAVKVGPDIEPFALQALEKLTYVLHNMDPKRNRSLHQNCAITIGRLGYVCPQTLAPLLPVHVLLYCIIVSHLLIRILRKIGARHFDWSVMPQIVSIALPVCASWCN